MSLKDLFHIFSKEDYEKELKKKIAFLESNINELKETIAKIPIENQEQTLAEKKDPPIIIEKIHIDKIVLDKYELNNNFGQLGIKELKGKLNIGATYGSEFIPKPEEEENKRKLTKKKMEKTQTNEGPKVNLYAKQED
jgi:glucan-binding YG repeat protein